MIVNFLLLCISALCIVASATHWSKLEEMNYGFDHFVNEFSPVYKDTQELEFRKRVFEENLAMILKNNRIEGKKWKMGVSPLTDRTNEEFKKMLGYQHPDPKTRTSLQASMRKHVVSKKINYQETSVDWREKGAVTPVKNQGACGSCWAVSSAQVIESFWFLKSGQMMDLSMQQIASCTKVPADCRVQGTGGCNGSSQIVAFHSLMQSGIISEWRYPYLSEQGQNYPCALQSKLQFNRRPDAIIESVYVVEPNSYEALMDAVATAGPVTISVDASMWHHYSEGVYDSCSRTRPTIDHAVQLVGYGTDMNGVDYWIVRNSWSVTWGENGYIRVLRESEPTCGNDPGAVDCEGGPTFPKVCGMCGILYDNSYPGV